ncbi:hypothetical protein [Winogradskyella sp. A3E31]|uniref:hypothetical protein n=1 Tax=Winogradskyella sp. A3E31 TaxID=3349637 RepID=UPI00398AC711
MINLVSIIFIFMKKITLFLFLVSFVSCSAQKEATFKTKKFSNEELIFQYPKTWHRFGGNGYVFLKPKLIYEYGIEDGNHLLVNKSYIEVKENDSILQIIDNYARILKRHEVDKSFKIIKLGVESNFNYKVEYSIKYSFSDLIFKREEYFKKVNSHLKFASYQMQEDLFDQYLFEAKFIINSIEYK